MQFNSNIDELLQYLINEFSQVVDIKLKEHECRLLQLLPVKEEKYYTVSQVAILTKFERATVYKWINAKKLQVVEVGKNKRIKESDLKTFMDTPAYLIKIKRNLTVKNK